MLHAPLPNIVKIIGAPISAQVSCHVCGRPALVDLLAYAEVTRVTSDCKPWPKGGRLAVCQECGLVQVPATAGWRMEIAQIYRDYTIYYQGDGAEQAVFDSATGQSFPRSTQISRCLRKVWPGPTSGKMLDVGCGNGSFLRRFHEQFPNWQLAGSEWDDKYRAQVERLPKVEKHYVGRLSDIPGGFQLISLIHVLEHIENPAGFLAEAQSHLADEGLLFIEVPHFVDNPFELLIADHATHFTLESLCRLVESAGFELLMLHNEWVPKEISLLARKKNRPSPLRASPHPYEDLAAAQHAVEWLANIHKQAMALSTQTPCLGLFGTSIAGTWLGGGLANEIAFFVDEDVNRTGKTHLGKPILSPASVPQDSDVFVGLAPKISSVIARRLTRPGVRYHPVVAIA